MRTFLFLLMLGGVCCAKGQSPKDTVKKSPECIHFKAHIVEKHGDGTRTETDTLSQYQKYFYPNGKLRMEGKLIKSNSKDYPDGIWLFYNELGELMKKETSAQAKKVNELDFLYFKNGKPMSKTYLYYEGNYKERLTFKFYKQETLYYTNGRKLAERLWVNNTLVEDSCWDSKGNPKPIDYIKNGVPFDAKDK